MKLVLILLLGIVINQVICESTTVFIGPRTIEPNGKDETDDIENPEWLENLENPLAMHSFQVRLIDPETQEELSQDEAYLHHLLISGENIRNVPCPEYEYWNFVAGAGAELTFIHIPAPFAYKINPGDEWEFALHVMNPNNITLEYTLEVTYELSNWTEEYTEVEGFLLGAGGCEDPDLDFNVPKNDTADSFIIHVDYPSSVTGQFVFMGAHLHRYGKNLFLSRTSTGEVPFTANVHYDDLEHPDYITSIDSSTNRISVTMGEPLRLTGVYDCQKKHKGVMAILYGYIFVEQVYDLSNGPLPQVVEYDNPFKIPADILGSDVEQSDVEQSSVIVNSTEPVPNSSAIESSDNDDNNEETGAEEKEHKAVLGLVSSIGLILMFIVAVLLLVAVVVLFRIKHKRSLEIFD